MKMKQRFLSIAALIMLILVASNLSARTNRYRHAPVNREPRDVSVEPAEEVEAAPVYPSAEGSGFSEGDLEWLLKSSTPEGGVHILTLTDCISLALQNNQRLIAAGYEVEAARNQLTEAKANFWPVLEYKYRIAPVPTDVDDAFNKFFEGELTLFNSIHFGIGVPISTFGQLQMARRLAEGGVQAAQVKTVGTRYDTVFQVKQLYYGIQLAREIIKLLSDAVDQLDKKINDEEAKEEKEMDPYDVIQIKVFKVELERRLAEAEQNLDLAYEGMKIQLDLEPDAEIQLDSYHLKPLTHELDEEQDFIEVAVEHQPNSKLMDIGVETKKRQYRLEKFKLLPKLGFGFFVDVGRSVGFIQGLRLTDDFNDPFNYTRAGLGLQLSGDLDFHGAYARIKKARAEYYKASYERHIARKGLGLEMKKAYLTAKRLRGEVFSAKKAESLAHQMTFLSKMNLDMGIGDNEKYADALKLVLLTRGQYFKTVFDFNVALAELERRIGAEKYNDLITVPDMAEHEVFTIDSGDMDNMYEDDSVDMEGIENEDTQM